MKPDHRKIVARRQASEAAKVAERVMIADEEQIQSLMRVGAACKEVAELALSCVHLQLAEHSLPPEHALLAAR